MGDRVMALKFLTAEGRGPYSKFAWPLPKDGRPGKWTKVDGDLAVCKRGIHACTLDQATDWLDARCFVIELRDAESVDGKLLAPAGRLVRELPWDTATFAKACALRARRHAVKALRSVGLSAEAEALHTARGWKAIRDAARAAGDAARAAGDAARRAAGAAAGVAGDAADAAWDAASDAAWAVAGDAVWAAEHAARDAAREARDAAWAVARDPRAAGDAWDAERRWQVTWLRKHLNVPEVTG